MSLFRQDDHISPPFYIIDINAMKQVFLISCTLLNTFHFIKTDEMKYIVLTPGNRALCFIESFIFGLTRPCSRKKNRESAEVWSK